MLTCEGKRKTLIGIDGPYENPTTQMNPVAILWARQNLK